MTTTYKERLLREQGYYYRVVIAWPEGKKTIKEFGNLIAAQEYFKGHPGKTIHRISTGENENA